MSRRRRGHAYPWRTRAAAFTLLVVAGFLFASCWPQAARYAH